MKLCKVEIVKKMTGDMCKNIYPVGYNPYKIEVISYDEEPLNEGDNIGYCIGLVEDDFAFTDKMAEITKAEGDTFIDDRASKYSKVDDETNYKNRKQALTDAGI